VTALIERAAADQEMEQARHDFRQLTTRASAADLGRRSDGTKWTNRQLLFHMLLGYLIVRALLVLARVFGRRRPAASKAFARLLDAARGPFHLVNYLGSCIGARIIPTARMPGMLDKITGSLQRCLRHDTDDALRLGMHFPTTWDPFFSDYMTLADIYRYPIRHYQFHRRQLTLPGLDSQAGIRAPDSPRRESGPR
jgi:DinB superfamily